MTRDGRRPNLSCETKFSDANGDHLPCSADHEQQDWQPYPVDPYSATCIYFITIHHVIQYIQTCYMPPLA